MTEPQLPSGARLALSRLTAALAVHLELKTGVAPIRLVVGLAGSSAAVDEALAGLGIACPQAPESLAIGRLPDYGLVIAGRDELGLAYALAEVARTVGHAQKGTDPLTEVVEAIEEPSLSWRSMQLFLCNRDLESEWYFDSRFWNDYLDQLVDFRYNNLSLTFGHQTPYLTPPYPFLVDMSDFEEVGLLQYTVADRERGLQALRQVSELTRERGLHFTLGIWSQRPEPFGEPMISGLDKVDMVEFNAVGLERLLAACPQIDGVQFRMNYESGIPEDRQAEFYQRQFRAVAECGRPIRLDLRAKGLSDEVADHARSVVADTVVSTKFWCEHLGQPYAMPAIRREDVPNYRRYGYWDLLKKPGKGRLIYRLWSAGSQRALLWGDPEWVRRFVEACASHSDGFEVMAPLTNKGGINHPGVWRLIGKRSLQPYDEEYRRYWMFFLLFGRTGYNAGLADEVWRRELRVRFGDAAESVTKAYASAGRILPLLTTVLQPSASLWSFWPETYAGRSLKQDVDVEPSDPTQFYGVVEYVQEAVAGQLCGKWSPFHVADLLEELAQTTEDAVAAADGCSAEANRPEYLGTRMDMLVYAHLARYHAERLRSMANLAFFLQAGASSDRIRAASNRLAAARMHWQKLVELTDGAYHDDLVFGYRTQVRYPEGLLARGQRFRHDRHWKDRLSVIDADEKYLADTAAQNTTLDGEGEPYPGERSLPAMPAVDCRVPKNARPGRTLQIDVRVEEEIRAVIFHYKPMLQSHPFHRQAMERRPAVGEFTATIPAAEIKADWNLMLFFELRLLGGEARRWPDWRRETPYLVIQTT